TDRRGGTFTTALSVQPDGTPGAPASYALDRAEQTSDARYAFVAPELRVGTLFGSHVEISAGVEAFAAFALTQPRWDSGSTRVITGNCRPDVAPGCVSDGLATYDSGTLTAKALVLVSPGVALRYEF